MYKKYQTFISNIFKCISKQRISQEYFSLNIFLCICKILKKKKKKETFVYKYIIWTLIYDNNL